MVLGVAPHDRYQYDIYLRGSQFSGAINMVLSVVEIDILDKWLQAMISGVGVS